MINTDFSPGSSPEVPKHGLHSIIPKRPLQNVHCGATLNGIGQIWKCHSNLETSSESEK